MNNIDDKTHNMTSNELNSSAPISGIRDESSEAMTQPQYSLLIATNAGDIEGAFNDDESDIALGATSVGGKLVIYINDSPWRLHYRGSGLFPIYPLLGPGKNTIRIEGNHSEKMYAKVVTVDPKTFNTSNLSILKVITKAWLDPSINSVTLEFDSGINSPPDFEELVFDKESEEKIKNEIHKLVQYWINCYKKHDMDAIIEAYIPDLKNHPKYIMDRETFIKGSRVFINEIKKGSYDIKTTTEDVKIVVGKRSVLLYTDVESNPTNAYLFKFLRSDGRAKAYDPPLTVGKLEGKWIGIYSE
jgi:hypothetical protein